MNSWAGALAAFGLAAIAAGSPDSADASCKCRAKGVVATEGQTLCIRTPQGTRLARCGKVSNVASWTFLEGPCPQAAGGGLRETPPGEPRPSVVSPLS